MTHDETSAGNGATQRTLPAYTPYFTRATGKRKLLVLEQKPDILQHLDTVDERIWKQYEAHMGRVTLLERAEFYRHLMEERRIKSICALGKVVRKDEAGIRHYLNLLRLPDPIQQFLRENRTNPAYVRYLRRSGSGRSSNSTPVPLSIALAS